LALFFAALLCVGALAAASAPELTLVRTTTLQGDTHHVQGIEFDDSHLWVTSVDKTRRRGYLQEFSLSDGRLRRTIDVSTGDRFHPGGVSASGESLWVPVAEYRRASSSVLQKRSLRTLKLEYEFAVADHIGCVAAAPEALIGANWDSRDFYVWDKTGRLIRKMPNPTTNAYQDMKFVDGRLIASGLLPGGAGAIDWLKYPSLGLIQTINVGRTDRGIPYTSEGMAIHGNRLLLLPEDSPSRLFEFRLPPSEKLFGH
jgi:hypothetical protein